MIVDVIKGWLYLLAYVTGGNFIRKSRIKKVGIGVKIAPTAFFKHPENIEIGSNTFINHLCSVWASPEGPIRIGSDVLFGPHVCVIASNHGIGKDQLIRLQPGEDAAITIGNDVWIGANVVVTAGVTIGDGVVIGAGSIVTKDLPTMSVCVGVPAKVLRFRS
jgi:acetyltransferase-like isoleucine patch superfamily enzyme